MAQITDLLFVIWEYECVCKNKIGGLEFVQFII